MVVEEVHRLKADQHHDGGCHCHIVHPHPSRHANGRGDPQASSRGEALDDILLEDDSACANEADAADHLCRHTGRVALDDDTRHGLIAVEAMHRQHHEQGRPQTYEEMGAEAGLLRAVFTLQADGTTQDGADEYGKYVIPSHCDEELRG